MIAQKLMHWHITRPYTTENLHSVQILTENMPSYTSIMHVHSILLKMYFPTAFYKYGHHAGIHL